MENLAYSLAWISVICGGTIFALITLSWLAFTAWSWVRHQIADWSDTRRVLRASRLLKPPYNVRQEPPRFFQGFKHLLNPSRE